MRRTPTGQSKWGELEPSGGGRRISWLQSRWTGVGILTNKPTNSD